MSDRKLLKREVMFISAGLVLLIAAAFEPVRHNAFVQYDDEAYITQNPEVLKGLTLDSVRWAFTTKNQTSNWHPLTWISHMLDIELFGLNPLGHHLHNLVLHTLAVVLLFWLLTQMTGAVWPSAFAALFFGIHPLRVESVAWAAERKDVLCMLFFMLTAAAYLYYVNRGGKLRYLLVAVCFALGLMAKPMLVSVPIVLLILDIWPLRRTEQTPFVRLLVEKIPLFILTIISCVVTYFVQQRGGSMMLDHPLSVRISNALISCAGYLGNMFYPVGLGVLYPYSDRPLWQVIAAGMLLAAITGFVIYRFGRYPWLAAGWFWYIITLVPVIGIVQVGQQACADRYTYLPSLGIAMALAMQCAQLSGVWKKQKIIVGIFGGLLAAAMIVGTRTQLTYWKDTNTLFEHTLAVTGDNVVMHINYAVVLARQNKPEQAVGQAQKAIEIQPLYVDAYNNMANILMRQNQHDKAVSYTAKALELEPDNIIANNAMAVILSQRGQIDQAIGYLQKVLALEPDDVETNNNMASVLMKQNRVTEAGEYLNKVLRLRPDNARANSLMADILIDRKNYEAAADHLSKVLKAHPDDVASLYRMGIVREAQNRLDESAAAYQQVIGLDPTHADAFNDLGVVSGRRGRLDQAIAYLQQSLRLNPDNAQACQNLGIALKRKGRAGEAVVYYRRAARLQPDNYERYRELAFCLYAAGQSPDAITALRKAIDLAQAAGQTEEAGRMEERLRLYQAGSK